MLYRRSCWLSILNIWVCMSSFKSYRSPLHHIIQVVSDHLVLTPSSLNFKTALSQGMIGLLVLPKDHGFNWNFILFSYSKTLSCFNLVELCNKCHRLESLNSNLFFNSSGAWKFKTYLPVELDSSDTSLSSLQMVSHLLCHMILWPWWFLCVPYACPPQFLPISSSPLQRTPVRLD